MATTKTKVKELDETFPGIEAVNDFYTPYYMREYFPSSVRNIAERWKSKPVEDRPSSRLKALRQDFATLNSRSDVDLFAQERIAGFLDSLLTALGYQLQPDMAQVKDDVSGKTIPLRLQVMGAKGAPQLQVLVNLNDDGETGVLEGVADDSAGANATLSFEDYARMLLADFDKPTRWVMVLGIHQIALIDRRKWADKQCLLFDLDTIFSRHQDHVYNAMAVLLHHDSLCPESDTDDVMDSFDEESSKQSVAVSDSLRSALRECVEILGNEVIYDWTHNKHRDVADIDASELTMQALRYMYRLLFLLFIEAKPQLGYAPMKSEAYRTAYSLDSLRDIAEQMRGRMDEAGDSTYLADTLRKLDDMVFNGYPSDKEIYRSAMSKKVTNGMFVVPPLKAHIFDPERTSLIENAALRDSEMLKIIDLMSVTNGEQGHGRKGRRQRISYAALGISQMGAVYEALLSYRGFIAKETLYEVKKAGSKYDPLEVGYFVTASQLADYVDDYDQETGKEGKRNERVRYESGPHKGELRTYAPGTFVYRLAGRERETSASYYTPDSLAQCLVKYALKEIEPRIKKATDILDLKICEPAMGSATFLNEVINQLAAMYLNMREKERVDAKEKNVAIPAERRQAELQKVKMYIADHNIYGIDLNPIAVELGEVSLWLNTICEGSYVPWFGTQLVCGNSLIGARRVGYPESELKGRVKGHRWYEKEPAHIAFNRSSVSTSRVYQFLTGDPGMCSYDDAVVKKIEKEHLDTIKQWKKKFTAPYTDDEVKAMRHLSEAVDELWRGQIKTRRQLEQETQDTLSIYGYETNQTKGRIGSDIAERGANGQVEFDDMTDEVDSTANLSIREKDEMLSASYRSEQAVNASEYARLKLAMDYWCALWFWPIDQADKLPSRSDYLTDMALILTGEVPDEGFRLAFMEDQPTLLQASEPESDRNYMRDHKVNLGDLRSEDNDRGARIRLVESIAKKQHFFHWELEFADVFKDGGFDMMIGNPPWVKFEWKADAVISDINPTYAVHKKSSAEFNQGVLELLQDKNTRKYFLSENISVEGALAFYRAVGNYPLIQGKPNLFRFFLPNAWDYTRRTSGVSAFVHPDELYGDTKADALHEQMYRRLKYHFQFINERKLFAGVDHHTSFSLNVYENPSKASVIGFDSIWNLYTPKTIDDCYEHDGTGAIPQVKNAQGEWDITGHKDRIVHVDRQALALFSRLVGDGNARSWKTAPLVGVYAEGLLAALESMASTPETLRDYSDGILYSSMWNETNARKDGTIQDDVHFPQTTKALIYSSPFIGVGNPLLQTTRRNYRVNSDYDLLDLTDIPEDYLPRVKYSQACSDEAYAERMPKFKNDEDSRENQTRLDAVYRLCNREYVGLASERTLQASCVHPGCAWVHTIAGYGVHPERYAMLALMSGLEAALPIDFFVRSAGKTHLNRSVLESLPVPASCLSEEIALRGLLLNCLTKHYADLWHSCWESSFATMDWSKQDKRLKPSRFNALTGEWDWDTPLRTDYERRQALVELDVLASMALGITLDELIDIYRLTFTVLREYEENTWYDANGRVTFSTKKTYGNLTYDRKDFERIQNAPAGQSFTRTITDDTQPGGPRERAITYVAPFDTCDRVQDYRTAWAYFERKYGDQLAAERQARAERLNEHSETNK